MCVCSLSYPAYNAHVPYIFICGLSGCKIFFPHYLINATMFEKVIKQKMCFDVLNNFERFLILKTADRNLIKMYIGLHAKYPLFLAHFNKS